MLRPSRRLWQQESSISQECARTTLSATLAFIQSFIPHETKETEKDSITLLIEAGLKALNIAPGLRRSFAAEKFGFIPKKVWQEARAEAAEQVKHDAQFMAYGYDIDKECVTLTQMNAKKAGVKVTCEQRDIRNFELPQQK